MSSPGKIRKKKKYVSPNPLFVKWLTEWKQEAAEKGYKTQYVYAKALSSLKKYPLPLSSGKEAKILEYFGDKICSMLDAKLLEWKQTGGGSLSSSQTSTGSSSSSLYSVSQSCSSSSSSPQRRRKAPRPPAASGMGLSSSQSSVASSSSSLPSVIPLTSSSTSSSPRKTKTVESEIGVKTVHLGRVNTVPKLPTVDTEVNSSDVSASDYRSFYLFPGNFSIVLCVDNCETFSGQGRNKKLFLSELQKSGVSFDVRKLHVGDFLWVARENSGAQRELVLNFIIERKRMDDLARSIKDGRFKEQKISAEFCISDGTFLLRYFLGLDTIDFWSTCPALSKGSQFRMKTCGLKNPIYLVEKGRESNYLGLPVSTCEQAIVNTQVVDGFMIKRTLNTKESVNYLSTMTNMIRNKFQNTTLKSAPKEVILKKKNADNNLMTFSEFNTTSMKNKSLTVREMFAKHLLQFFGLSVDRAAAIVDVFDTPSKFLEAYDKCSTQAEKEKLVSSIKFGLHKKNIGPAISKSLYQFYCAESPPK